MSLSEATDTPPYSVVIEPRTTSRGGNLLASWRTTLSDHSDVTAQTYVDVTDRNDPQLRSHVETYDLDLKHHLSSERHDIVWGVDARIVRDRLDSTSIVQFVPDHELRDLLGVFAQDEIAVDGSALRLTLGVKAEHTHDAGLEWQPTARALWSPDARQSVWTAVSRAVRTPSRAETDIRYHVSTVATGGPPAVVTLEGSPSFLSENLVAYEAGYRIAPTRSTLIELTAFYNIYSDLRTIEPGTSTFEPTPSPHIDVRQIWSNKMHGDTRGIEASASWAVTSSWKLDVGGSCLAMRLHTNADSQDMTSANAAHDAPDYQFSLQSRFNPTPRWEWDTAVYQVGPRASQNVKAYTRLDVGFTRRLYEGIQLSLLGRNLVQKRHLEDNGVLSGLIPTEVQRSVTARIGLQF
jgi:iron complex outermembrane receptor protein